MAERINFQTKELAGCIMDTPVGTDFLDRRFWSVGAKFHSGAFAELRMQEDSSSSTLQWADIIAVDLGRGVCCYYDYAFWAQPFETGFQPDELSGFYPAVINFSSAKLKQDIVSQAVHYGTFWYDQAGRVKAVNTAHLTRSCFDRNNPLLNLARVSNRSWCMYRRDDVYHMPDKQEIIEDGKEYIFDEIATKLTDDGQILTLQQQSQTGHLEKIIQVPSSIDIARWINLMQQKDGGWIEVFRQFPGSITLKL